MAIISFAVILSLLVSSGESIRVPDSSDSLSSRNGFATGRLDDGEMVVGNDNSNNNVNNNDINNNDINDNNGDINSNINIEGSGNGDAVLIASRAIGHPSRTPDGYSYLGDALPSDTLTVHIHFPLHDGNNNSNNNDSSGKFNSNNDSNYKRDFDAVVAWIRGVSEAAARRAKLHGYASMVVETDAGTASKLFGCNFHRFRMEGTGDILVRHTGKATVPSSVEKHIGLVTGLSELWPLERSLSPVDFGGDNSGGTMKKKKSESSNVKATQGDKVSDSDVLVALEKDEGNAPKNYTGDDIPMTPSFLEKLYRIPRGLADGGGPGSGLSIAGFFGNYSAVGLSRFQKLFSVQSRHFLKGHPAVVPEGAVPHANSSSLERSRDIPIDTDMEMQTASGVAGGLDVWYWGMRSGEWVLEWANDVIAAHEASEKKGELLGKDGSGQAVPRTHVLTYTLSEQNVGADGEGIIAHGGSSYASKYITQANARLKQLADLGYTIVVAAGDEGNPGTNQFCPIDRGDSAGCSAAKVVYKEDNGPDTTCVYPAGAWRCPIIDHVDCVAAREYFFEDLANSVFCKGKLIYDTGAWDPTTMSTRAQPSHGGGVSMTSSCQCSTTKEGSAGRCTVSGFDYDREGYAQFGPAFPASSPHVVAVGATKLKSKDIERCAKGLCRERSVSRRSHDRFTSGGGFSLSFPQSNWQRGAVESYLGNVKVESSLPPASAYNANNRAFPDLSAVGTECVVVKADGTITVSEGTACSAAIVGAMMAIINDRLIGRGSAPLGNPGALLYEMALAEPSTFNDVTEGDGCCSKTYCCASCFHAAYGWDPVGGLGTPNMDQILQYIDAEGSSAKGVPLSRTNEDGQSQMTSFVPEHKRVSIDDVSSYAKYYLIGAVLAILVVMGASLGWGLYLLKTHGAGYSTLATDGDDTDGGNGDL